MRQYPTQRIDRADEQLSKPNRKRCDNGCDNRQERHVLHDKNGDASESQSERQGWKRGTRTVGEDVSNARVPRRGARCVNRSKILRGNRFGGTLQTIREGCEVRNELDSIRGLRSAKLGNTPSEYRQGSWQARKQIPSTCNKPEVHRGASRRGKQTAQLESGLGRVADGLPSGMDRPRLIYDVASHQFPAPRGVPQHDFEPPRVTGRKDLRRDRIKALGNAVVPQVIYPIAQEVFKYLTK